MTVIPSLRLMCKNYVQAPNVGALFDQSLDERDAESITKANKKQVRRKKKKHIPREGARPKTHRNPEGRQGKLSKPQPKTGEKGSPSTRSKTKTCQDKSRPKEKRNGTPSSPAVPTWGKPAERKEVEKKQKRRKKGHEGKEEWNGQN